MLVCPKCGSIHISEIGYSGFSGYTGQTGASGCSGVSGSGYTPPINKVQDVSLGFSVAGLSQFNPNINVNPAPQSGPPYQKTFRCSDCNWTGKESELMDDFKYEIIHANKQSTVKDPTETAERLKIKIMKTMVIKRKNLWKIIVDKIFGKKRKQC